MARPVSGKARPRMVSVRLSEAEYRVYRDLLVEKLTYFVLSEPGLTESDLFRLLLSHI